MMQVCSRSDFAYTEMYLICINLHPKYNYIYNCIYQAEYLYISKSSKDLQSGIQTHYFYYRRIKF